MKAWHFVGATLRDGSPIPADGITLVYPGKPILCEQGLHASLHPFDALRYAPGATLCLVECSGTVLHQPDKLVCTQRKILARMDATDLLYYFARMQALSVAHLWDPEQAVLDYLMTGENRNAAESAARIAARIAAWSAAESAARIPAWSAAWSAAGSAAWSAARDAAREEFNSLVLEAFADYL